ncbi:MAG: hypothetical protein B7Y25_06530 [Alphaproteobacteria bacterium 16-39-46]|nr:MAG: hypothetical protein B7Y25_06530 [Alphaproteobacteria bacterium 16-39-46]OZA42294.1 MAG: hypothetical protein B7X84_06605 [Alphaproteobacteria bacterium 17-39-52]HQS84037.1 alpha/beta hydrolase [Alphaproteobacteria bacterium]HQS93900.1 alpha/beta hydrolase [Alphaproteobacteria bacterium]
MKFFQFLVCIGLIFLPPSVSAFEDITPYKFTETDLQKGLSELSYNIPPSSRFTLNRPQENVQKIIYYISVPKEKESYPLAILCTGSSSKDDISSIIHLHRYFLQEFLDLGSGVLTVEQWGVDGNNTDPEVFMTHYTRSQRLEDHQNVINFLKSHPPKWWNGKLVFLGVSEGGPLVTRLTELYPDITIATLNWSGAGDWSWDKELWAFLENMFKNAPLSFKLRRFLPNWVPFFLPFPKTKKEYDLQMQETLLNPTPEKEFMGMTYQYHADALLSPPCDYEKLKTPFLVVAGTQDSLLSSTDAFVQKARDAGANITYFRIEDMDHFVRKRPDIIQKSFEWLKRHLT